jgi:hypothetical protein
VTGVSAASAIGSATATLPVSLSVTGVSAASAIGSATATVTVSFSVTGVSAASGIGSVQINFAFTADGVSATSTVSQATVWSKIDTSQTPNWTKIAA